MNSYAPDDGRMDKTVATCLRRSMFKRFEAICKALKRRPADLGREALEELVKKYEQQIGGK